MSIPASPSSSAAPDGAPTFNLGVAEPLDRHAALAMT
jgi:hypothetical protein